MSSKYFYLINITNDILSSTKINKIKFYLQYLYILKEHPEVIKQYDRIFSNNNKKKKIKIFDNIINIFKKIYKYFFHILSKNKYFYKNNCQNNNLDILIFSNLINLDNIDQSDDFYFGSLSEFLKSINKNHKIIYRNLTNLSSDKVNKIANKNFIILPTRVKLMSELILFFKIIYYYIQFNRDLKHIYYQTDKKIYNFFTNIDIFFSIIVNLRFEIQVKYLLNKFKPKNIICTFEGHSWERILFKTVNESKRNIKCIAFQHTVFTKNQNSIFFSFPKNLSPQKILTIGNPNKNILKKYIDVNKISVIGSPKNNLLKLNYKNSIVNDKFLRILILPEAFASECSLMLKAIVKRCEVDHLNEYIFRLHPMMKIEDLESQDKVNFKFHNNLLLSKQSLQDDINSCDIVIYRGSASVIQSCVTGIFPIYYNNYDEFSIDPLFNFFKDKINYCNNTNELDSFFDYYLSKWHNDSQSVKKNLINYCNEYFEKMDYSKIINHMNI